MDVFGNLSGLVEHIFLDQCLQAMVFLCIQNEYRKNIGFNKYINM
jgi:hypothetical protein